LTKSDNSWHASAAVYRKYSAAKFTQIKCTTIGSAWAPHRTETFVGVGCVVVSTDQVLHDGDVVSRSSGFETTTACQDAGLSVVPEHKFLDELVKAGSGLPLLWEFLHQTPWAGSTIFQVAIFL